MTNKARATARIILRMSFDAAKFDAALQKCRPEEMDRASGRRWRSGSALASRAANMCSRARETAMASGKCSRTPRKNAQSRFCCRPKIRTAVNYDAIAKGDCASLCARHRRNSEAMPILYGLLDFDGEAHWNTRWAVAGGRAYAKWKMEGVTFDAALKGAIDQCRGRFFEAGQDNWGRLYEGYCGDRRGTVRADFRSAQRRAAVRRPGGGIRLLRAGAQLVAELLRRTKAEAARASRNAAATGPIPSSCTGFGRNIIAAGRRIAARRSGPGYPRS